MRIIFMGTPEFAVPTLDALVAAGHEVVAAYTQPPRPGGRRGREPVASPVQRRAESHGIPVRSPVSFREDGAMEAFAALDADVAIVAAYGLILPQPVLEAPRLGCINVHGSLLPRWRGAAPIQRAILAGDAETGVGIMQMERGLDTGPVRLEDRTPIGRKTAGELTVELADMGARLLAEVLTDVDRYPPQAQPDEGVTYAAKIDKAEARLRFDGTAEEAERAVRAFNPAPGAHVEIAGERFRIHAAEVVAGSGSAGEVLDDRLTIACAGGGALRPTSIQRAGRGVMTAAELLRGFPIPAGTIL
ncbi:methionyl-tRNA formyltransferase [Sphingomonas adhaesiva]|uniref:methionyl-tRNA formyltransferase n=1 Tax=Sphingomonas adhaesiva TaxID=28212 RepID=UPI002FF93255